MATCPHAACSHAAFCLLAHHKPVGPCTPVLACPPPRPRSPAAARDRCPPFPPRSRWATGSSRGASSSESVRFWDPGHPRLGQRSWGCGRRVWSTRFRLSAWRLKSALAPSCSRCRGRARERHTPMARHVISFLLAMRAPFCLCFQSCKTRAPHCRDHAGLGQHNRASPRHLRLNRNCHRSPPGLAPPQGAAQPPRPAAPAALVRSSPPVSTRQSPAVCTCPRLLRIVPCKDETPRR